jgi:hypothetical protein
MLKSKGAMIGVAVALVGAVLLAGGMAVGTTAGAGTDNVYGGPVAGFPDLSGPAPAAPTEPTVPGTTPGPTPGNPAGIPGTGNAGAGATGPNALPSAGFGVTDDGHSSGAMVVLMAMAGAALVGAGAAATSKGRRN